MKIACIQFSSLVHVGSEPVTSILIDDKRWDEVVFDEHGVNVYRKDRHFFIPKQNITCVEYVRERPTDISPKVTKKPRGKKQK